MICSDFTGKSEQHDHYSTSRLSSECRCNYNLKFLVLDHKLDLIYKSMALNYVTVDILGLAKLQ